MADKSTIMQNGRGRTLEDRMDYMEGKGMNSSDSNLEALSRSDKNKNLWGRCGRI